MEKPAINDKYLGCFDNLKRRGMNATAIVIHHTCTKTPKRTRETLKKKGYSTHFEIVKKNVVCGNFLKPETIFLFNWKEQKEFCLKDCEKDEYG